MKFSNVHDLLKKAGSDAEAAYSYNLDKPSHMRISRVGQPLVSLLLEDFVFSKLPQLAQKKVLTEAQQNGERVKRTMAQATGYLFEQIVIDLLSQKPDLKIFPQYKVDLGYLSGTCDIVVVNEAEARVTVVECKALKYSTKREACREALFNDAATGYLSQLAVYKHALKQNYSYHEVNATWMVWCKGSASLFKVPFTEANADEAALMQEVMGKCTAYKNFKLAFESKDIHYCLNFLPLSSLPLKKPFYSGWSATCSAHYSPWASLLVDESGVPWDDYQENLTLMLKVCLSDDVQAKETLLKLIQEH